MLRTGNCRYCLPKATDVPDQARVRKEIKTLLRACGQSKETDPARGGRSTRHPARGVSCCAPCCAPAASSLGRSLRSRLAISIHPPALPQSLLKVPPDRTTGRVAPAVSRLKRSRAVAEHGGPAERTALGLSGSVVVERVQRRTVLTAVGFHTYHFSVQLGSVCTVCALSSLNAISVPRCKRSLRLSENSVCERAT